MAEVEHRRVPIVKGHHRPDQCDSQDAKHRFDHAEKMKNPGIEVYRTLDFFAALYFLAVFVLPLWEISRNLQVRKVWMIARRKIKVAARLKGATFTQ